MTVDPEIPVPPTAYGGIERIVDMLVQGLAARGHDITLFAHPDSHCPCDLLPYPGRSSLSHVDTARNTAFVSTTVLHGRYDLVHSFGRLAYLLPLLPLRLPKLMSYQRAISPRSLAWGDWLARGSLHFAACAEHMLESGITRNRHVIYNAAPVGTYDFCDAVAADAPLIFLGRIERIKGPHLAIEVARRSGRKLVLAGNVPDGGVHRAFFEQEVQPHLDDHDITYVGPVDDARKNQLLGAAAALLMPVLWEEPFGIVMAEALACGTPVIGLHRGSVPEVVDHGSTGFVCDTTDDMVEAVTRIEQIDRRVCRHAMETRFSDTAMVGSYERLYALMRAA